MGWQIRDLGLFAASLRVRGPLIRIFVD